jgi:2-polyprenyl-6-methoxyphenol hydroxylase-like FAD-dependent oxidoreductase
MSPTNPSLTSSNQTAAAVDVLIIGAGPVGLTLANELARRKIQVRIIEKLPAIREVSKALILHVRTQEDLSKVGIMDEAIAEAEPMREVVVHGYGKHIGSWDLDGIDSPFPHPLIIGQNRTQHLLLDALKRRGVEVEWNTEALELQVDNSGATVMVRHTDPASEQGKDETIRASYVVGCEGSKSLVRKTFGLTFEGERYSGEQFIQADCKLSWNLPSGRSYLFLTTDGYMMVIELPNGVVRIFISIPDAIGTTHPTTGQLDAEKSLGAAEDISAEPTLDEIKSHFERLSGMEVSLSEPVWLARYRTSHRYANKFSEGRAFVAGDSGHVHVPIGGQGMNTGIQDAFNLGWKLAGVIKGEFQPSLLESYNEERHPVAENLIKGTDFAYKGILHPSEIKQRAVRLFGPFVMKTDIAQNFMRNTLEELTVSYPNSALTLDHGGSHGPKPGERCLDAHVVQHSDKRTIRLSDLSRTAEWTLLLFTGTHEKLQTEEFSEFIEQFHKHSSGFIETHIIVANQRAAQEYATGTSVLLDALHEAHTKFGVAYPAFYLIRPDNYIGFRGPLTSSKELMSYLDHFIVPQSLNES